MKHSLTRQKIARCCITACLLLLQIALAAPFAAAQNREGVTKSSPREGQARPAAQAKSSDTIIINSDLVTFTVSVVDSNGRHVTGLESKDFKVFDNNLPQEIAFFSDADEPLSVGIIFDVSGSMSGQKIQRAREALSKFIETSHPRDEYFLVGVSSKAELLMDRTRDSGALLDKLSFVEAKGQTALYDAAYLGLEKVMRGIHPKRALIIISDGQDNNSRYSFGQLSRFLKESDVLIYAVGTPGPMFGNQLDVYGKLLLSELASSSGGSAFFSERGAEMMEAFERIALDLRHQYSIGYRPSNFVSNGKWHRVKVRVTPPAGSKRLFVRSREGYFATGSPD